ncbi:MAG: response regulator, partial [Cyanobacteria bacterium J06555_13]
APLGLLLKEAKNGQEAVEIASAWQPHLIWMDLRMPVMDGYRATRQIKAAALNAVGSQSVALPADNSTAHFPIIIALSANSLPEEKAAALDCGCDDFIRKPFNTERIFDVMKQQLNLRYQYGELGSSKPGKLVQEASEQGELALTGEPDFTTELFEENNQPALSALSPSQLTALESATLRLEWDQILQIVEEIKVEHVALAETLTLMVHQFRYGQILESIQAARLQSSPVEASPVEASPVAEHLSR